MDLNHNRPGLRNWTIFWSGPVSESQALLSKKKNQEYGNFLSASSSQLPKLGAGIKSKVCWRFVKNTISATLKSTPHPLPSRAHWESLTANPSQLAGRPPTVTIKNAVFLFIIEIFWIQIRVRSIWIHNTAIKFIFKFLHKVFFSRHHKLHVVTK